MMKFAFARYLVPPDSYRWTPPSGGPPIESSDRKAWYDKIERYHNDNGMPLAANWREQAEDQLCRLLPPGWCLHDDGRIEYDTISTRMEIGDFWRGMDVIKSIVLHPDPFVSQEIADQRASICASCPANIQVPGCHSCLKVANHILEIKGSGETPSDSLLKACGICLCSNAAQVWVKVELLAKGVTPDMARKFELMKGHCWKHKALQTMNDETTETTSQV